MTTLSFLTMAITIVAAILSFLTVLRQTGGWPRWQSIPAGIVVATMCILAVLTMVHVVFDQTGADDSSFTTIVGQRTNQPSEEETEPPEETEHQMVMETKKRTFSFGRRNSHCSGSQDVRWPVKATPGWEINIHSIKDEVTVQSSRSNYDGVVDKTKDGFFVKGRVINSGDCIKAFGRTIAKDGRGSLHVQGTYIETRMVPDPS